MKVNTSTKSAKPTAFTYEGAPSKNLGPEVELQRAVMSCLLWEDTFYESGQSIADRIKGLIPKVRPEFAAGLAITARSKMKLRHVPLLVAREMARIPTHKHLVGQVLPDIVQRADELTEFLAIYWKDGKQPLSAQVKKGLGKAFSKFSEHQLAKYDRDAEVKLRDVLFLTHAKPKDATVKFTKVERKAALSEKAKIEWDLKPHEALYKKVVDRKLEVPDTWEVALSGGADKRETFERLMREGTLGGLAFLRNLRNMAEAGVEKSTVAAYMETADLSRVLPFRFIAAARAVPPWEDVVEKGMLRCLKDAPRLKGSTVLLVDGSASMNTIVSAKSDITRRDAACALGILLREICEDVRIICFSTDPWDIPPRRGFALRDAIAERVIPQATMLGKAVRYAQKQPCDRIIVITDEQSSDAPPAPAGTGYIVNVAGYQNGVGYGPWVKIDGWSEAIIEYIRAYEAQEL